MFVGFGIAGRQRGDVNRISDRLIAGTVDYVPQCLLGVLYRAALRISVPQVYQLLLLASPESAYAFAIHFDHSEAQVTFIEHYHFVLVYAVVEHVSENIERLS